MLTISKTLGWRYAKKGALNRLNRERSYVQSRLMPRFLPWRTKQNGTVSSAFWKSAVWSRVILSCLKERQADILDKKIYSTISAVNGLSTIFPMASSPCLLDCFPRSITFSLYFCFLCFLFLTPKIEINWQLQSKLAALKFVLRRRLGQKWQLGQSWLSGAMKHDTRVASKEKKKGKSVFDGKTNFCSTELGCDELEILRKCVKLNLWFDIAGQIKFRG